MGNGIMYGTRISDPIYNWTAAFNNEEFIDYIKYGSYSEYYIGYETEIPDNKYTGITKFKTVAFPNCYGSIGSSAFEGCTNLYLASFTSSYYSYDTSSNAIVNDIKNCAFKNCTSLQTANFSVLMHVGDEAFKGCTSLQVVSFPHYDILGDYSVSSWMVSIGDEAFKGCSSIYFSGVSNIGRIGKNAFENNTFSYMYLGNSTCRMIDDEAFKNCYNLSSACINVGNVSDYWPYGDCQLGSGIFEGCSNLSYIEINGASSVNSDTFGDLSSTLKLLNMGIPASYASYAYTSDVDLRINIGSDAFANYASLTNVSMPFIKEIGSRAFMNCSSISYFKNSLCSRIGEYAFSGCIGLTVLSFNEYYSSLTYGSSLYLTIDDYAFTGTNLSYLYAYNIESIGSSVLANGTSTLRGIYLYTQPSLSVSIPDELCNGASYLSVASTSGFTAIGNSAFMGCTTLPSYSCTTISYIGDHAFDGCTSLSLAYTPSCSYIGAYAFKDCSKFSMIQTYNCQTVGSHAFENCTSATVAVVATCTSIGDYAFNGCTNLSVISAISLASIGMSTFSGCTNLSALYAIYCSSIESHAFENHSSIFMVNAGLANVSIDVGEYAFANCSKMTNAIFGFKNIGSHAFENCYNLANVNGPASCVSIGESAFYGCSAIANTAFNQGVQHLNYIGANAFNGWSKLSTINLTGIASVPTLADVNAFDNISSGYMVMVPSSLYSDFINDSVWGLISSHISY